MCKNILFFNLIQEYLLIHHFLRYIVYRANYCYNVMIKYIYICIVLVENCNYTCNIHGSECLTVFIPLSILMNDVKNKNDLNLCGRLSVAYEIAH